MEILRKVSVLSAVAVLALAGCGGDDKPTASGGGSGGGSGSIVGVWELVPDEETFGINEWLFEFRADGIAVQNITLDFGGTLIVSGSVARYNQQDGKITYSGNQVTFNQVDEGSWEFEKEALDASSGINFTISGDVLEVTNVDDGDVIGTTRFRRSSKTLVLPQEALDTLNE